MKNLKILMAVCALYMVSCTNNGNHDDNHHDHMDTDHSHDGSEADHHHDPVHQEEFTINEDSTIIINDSAHHVHEDGTVHENH